MAKILKDRIPVFIAMGVAAVLIGIDRVTKWWIVNNIEYRGSVPGIRFGDFKLLDITHIHNDGAAFSILSGQQTLLVTVTSIFLVGAIIAVLSGRLRCKWLFSAVTLIIAGGIGNWIDRIRLGYVLDFVEFQFVNFAVFNIADVFAVAGAILLCIAIIAEEVREYKAKRACGVGEEVEEVEEESQDEA